MLEIATELDLLDELGEHRAQRSPPHATELSNVNSREELVHQFLLPSGPGGLDLMPAGGRRYTPDASAA